MVVDILGLEGRSIRGNDGLGPHWIIPGNGEKPAQLVSGILEFYLG